MSSLFIKRLPHEFAGDSGKDLVTLANGLITIRVVKVREGRVHLLITAPEDIDITKGEENGNTINNDSSVTMGQ